MAILRSILLALFFLFLAGVSHGQAALLVLLLGDKAATEDFHFSIDAGLSLSSLPAVAGTSNNAGLYFGLGTYVRLNERWAFTPEFKPVSPRGGRGFEKAFTDNSGSVDDYSTRLILSYIDLPMQFHYQLNQRLYMRAGPQLSYLTKGEFVSTGALVGGPDFTVKENITGRLERFDVALPIDIGMVFAKPRGYKGVDIRVRYCPGFLEVFKANEAGVSGTNSTFHFFISLPFVNVEDPKP
jgi:hypothetical protein